MPITNFERKVIRILSSQDLNTKENYEIQRKIINFTSHRFLRPIHRIRDDIVRAEGREIPIRIFRPRQEGCFPLIIYLHGGGWVTGNVNSYDSICSRLAKITGRTIISAEYRLAPEHKFPAGVEDCYEVARYVVQNADQLGGEANTIVIMGDSAGANLATVTCMMARDRGEFQLSKQILLYPATGNDYTESSIFPSVQENGYEYWLTCKRVQDYISLYQSAEDDLCNPYFAPYYAEDLSNMPPALIITAELDPLRDEGEAYGKKLQRFGCNVKIIRMMETLHGFYMLSSFVPEVRQAHTLILDFMNGLDVMTYPRAICKMQFIS